ncbi:MAG: hypothetical protein MK078_06080 [Crocinitomicaceae bacterium]|nr:hypothetical protein [Crocinitomicaceae bacterium]
MIVLQEGTVLEEEGFYPQITDQLLRVSCKILHVPIVSYKWDRGDWTRLRTGDELNVVGMDLGVLSETRLIMREKLIQAYFIWNYLSIPMAARSIQLTRQKSSYSWGVDFIGLQDQNREEVHDYSFAKAFKYNARIEAYETFKALITDNFFKESCARGLLEFSKETGREASLNKVVEEYFNTNRIQNNLQKIERFVLK